MDNLNNILYKPTCITYLHIRINKPIETRNVREFVRNMQNVQVHPYIPINAHLEIRLSIQRCLRNHSDNWKDVIKNYLLKNNKTRKLLTEQKQLLLGKEEQPSDYIMKYILQRFYYQLTHISIRTTQQCTFNCISNKYIGKATLSENIADTLLHYCDMRKVATVWDPFYSFENLEKTLEEGCFYSFIKCQYLKIHLNQCYLLIASDQFQFFDSKKWELLTEPLVGGQWAKIIKYYRNREPLLITTLVVPKENSQIISQSSKTDVIANKKFNNQVYFKHLTKETRTIAEKHAVFLKKLNIGTKTKVRSIMLRRANDLYKIQIRNVNLQIIKIKEQNKKEQIELKKQEVKDKVILDKQNNSKYCQFFSISRNLKFLLLKKKKEIRKSKKTPSRIYFHFTS